MLSYFNVTEVLSYFDVTEVLSYFDVTEVLSYFDVMKVLSYFDVMKCCRVSVHRGGRPGAAHAARRRPALPPRLEGTRRGQVSSLSANTSRCLLTLHAVY